MNKLQFHKLGQLYGRDAESRMLRDAWDAVRTAWSLECSTLKGGRRGLEAAAAPKPSSHARRLVTISGASGTGKSALSETLRHPVLRAGGIFAVGKFPQQRRVLQHTSAEPYAAFAAACSDLCELVVSLSSSEASVITTPLDSGYHDHSVSSHDDGDFPLRRRIGNTSNSVLWNFGIAQTNG